MKRTEYLFSNVRAARGFVPTARSLTPPDPMGGVIPPVFFLAELSMLPAVSAKSYRYHIIRQSGARKNLGLGASQTRCSAKIVVPKLQCPNCCFPILTAFRRLPEGLSRRRAGITHGSLCVKYQHSLPCMLSRMSSGITPLSGFFELWLRDTGAALMGAQAEEKWLAVRKQARAACSESEGLSQRVGAESSAPLQFSLDGAVFDAVQAVQLSVQVCMPVTHTCVQACRMLMLFKLCALITPWSYPLRGVPLHTPRNQSSLTVFHHSARISSARKSSLIMTSAQLNNVSFMLLSSTISPRLIILCALCDMRYISRAKVH